MVFLISFSAADYDNRDCVLHQQNSTRNPLIVPHGIRWLSVRNPLSVRVESADCPCGIRWLSARTYADSRAAICGFYARLSAEKVKFSVSCTVHCQKLSTYVHTSRSRSNDRSWMRNGQRKWSSHTSTTSRWCIRQCLWQIWEKDKSTVSLS